MHKIRKPIKARHLRAKLKEALRVNMELAKQVNALIDHIEQNDKGTLVKPATMEEMGRVAVKHVGK